MRVMNLRIPTFLCVLCVLCGESSLYAQKHLVLDLNQTIALANDSSLESFRTQNMYLSGYWEYRTYRANRLPSLTLDLTPAQYNRDITKRYDSGSNLDVYRTQQSYYAYGGLSVKQNLDLTGGTFYLESNLAYMRNFGDNSATQLTSVPVRIGYSQSLVGYNPFKWERKIEPLKYERVKKEFLYNVEKAEELARIMVAIGNGAGKKTYAVITDMSQPLGNTVGNIVEVQEAIEALNGKGPKDLMDVVYALGYLMLKAAGVAEDEKEARARMEKVIASGKALDKFADFVEAQGGRKEQVYHPQLLAKAAITETITAPEDGYVEALNAMAIGTACMSLGGGRETKESQIDLTAGIRLKKKIAQQ